MWGRGMWGSQISLFFNMTLPPSHQSPLSQPNHSSSAFLAVMCGVRDRGGIVVGEAGQCGERGNGGGSWSCRRKCELCFQYVHRIHLCRLLINLCCFHCFRLLCFFSFLCFFDFLGFLGCRVWGRIRRGDFGGGSRPMWGRVKWMG